jgi:5-methylcytosine-specific restriction endonuclease McrA
MAKVPYRLGRRKANSKAMRRRRDTLLRERNKCHYCGRKLNKKTATLDHVKPRSKGGKDGYANLVLACEPCNKEKGDRDAITRPDGHHPARREQ